MKLKNQTDKNRATNPFVEWGKKVNWKRRVKAVCKPCWELKYCPYGPLVEQFPLREPRDEKSCRIFGHDCPVFTIAEPLTETRELRNISRTIPRSVQFRVLKRENQICRQCGKAVQDEDVEFDHVIPWSKGGPSDESNIRLLCRTCNRKRRTDFESEALVISVREHLTEPEDIGMVSWLKLAVAIGHEVIKKSGSKPTAKDYAQYNNGEEGVPEQHASIYYGELIEVFEAKRPAELSPLMFKALRYRWGPKRLEVSTLKETAQRFACGLPELIDAERSLMRRFGFIVKNDKATIDRWTRL